MADRVISAPIGRVSEPNYTRAPEGALLEADNCVLRSPGVLSPVPGLERMSSIDGPSGAGVWQQSPQFDNGAVPDQLCHVSQGIASQNGVRKATAMGTEIQYTDADGAAASIEYYDHGDGLTMYPMYIARDNLYLADQRGVYKWESTDATVVEPVWDISAGADAVLNSGSSNDWLPTLSSVRYRVVVLFEDGNGVIRRSSPSPQVYIDSSAPGNRYVQLELRVNEAQADQFGSILAVEVYRSRTFSVTNVPNELYLVGEYAWSNFSAANGIYVYDVDDILSDSQLGASLYTNTSSGGAVSANVSPPEHLYHASFRGHEFWGNVSEKEFFEPLNYDVSPSTLTHTTTAGTYTNSTNAITGVGTLNGAEVGMVVSGAGGVFSETAYITDITGTTITMSEAAVGSGSSTFTFLDCAYILWGDGSDDRVVLYGTGVETPDVVDDPGNSRVQTFERYSNEDANPYTSVLLLSSRMRTSRVGTAQMWVNGPENFPGVDWADLGTTTDGTPTTNGTPALPATHSARLGWSKFQEPEVTALGNFQDVGNASGIGGGDLVGLGALRDALIILKADGVFRLTGNNGNWRIDPLDTSIRIIGGRSTQVMDDAVFTLSDRGLVRITAAGVDNISDGLVGDWFEENGSDGDPRLESVRRYMLNNSGYHPPALFSAADSANREYVLCCDGTDSPAGDGVTTDFLVFNAKTGAFTTWTLHESSAFPVSSLGYARGTYSAVADEQAPGITVARQVSSGDTSAGLFILDNRKITKAAIYATYEQDIRWRAAFEGDPTHIKLWRAVVWDTDGNAPDSGTNITAVFQDGETGADVTQAVTSTLGDEEIRVIPPISVARSTKLVAGIKGDGITIYGVRMTYVSSGRESPL